MDETLSLIGLAQLLFGILVGVLGITIAARVATRLAGLSRVDEGLRAGNAAVGITIAGAIVSMGILVQHAVTGTFDALGLLIHGPAEGAGTSWVLAYALIHVSLALGIGTCVLVLGTRAFVRLTPDVDELAEIRDGNIASAIVLASMLIVIAMLAEHGVETILNGLLPLPTLARDMLVPPS